MSKVSNKRYTISQVKYFMKKLGARIHLLYLMHKQISGIWLAICLAGTYFNAVQHQWVCHQIQVKQNINLDTLWHYHSMCKHPVILACTDVTVSDCATCSSEGPDSFCTQCTTPTNIPNADGSDCVGKHNIMLC